jgi:multiple sugar transport system permease protein
MIDYSEARVTWMSVIAESRAAQKRVGSNRRLILRRHLLFWSLTGPAVILFSLFLVEPLINMFRVSMLDWRGIIKPSTYVGLKNYIHLIGDEHFFNALRNTSIHMAMALCIILPISFMLGFFLSLRPPGYRVLRTIFFLCPCSFSFGS